MKVEVTVIETVLVKRKTKYKVKVENEQEILDSKGKSIDYLDVIEGETLTENDIETPIIIDIIKSKVIVDEENNNENQQAI